MTVENVRICAVCGKPITSGRADRKYCSEECYLKSKRLRKAEQAENERMLARERNEKIRKERQRKEKAHQRYLKRKNSKDDDFDAGWLKYLKDIKKENLNFEKKVLETIKTKGKIVLSNPTG